MWIARESIASSAPVRWAAAGGLGLLLAGLAMLAGKPGLARALLETLLLAIVAGGGLALVRRLLANGSGMASVAGAVIDEAVRMRSTLVLLLVLVASLPVLPLALDPTERLSYRVQFLLTWMLGGTSLILGLLTAFLACGTICGDIDSSRVHMTLAKPLGRHEYLLGKWLGIVLYDLVLLAVAGGGTYLLVTFVAAGAAATPADRDAVDREVLVARREIQPTPDAPEEYEAGIAAAIARLEADAPDVFVANPVAARQRIRREYEWQWHTIAADMETTYVFRGAGRSDAGTGYQLQLDPRANNVGVDFADVRFAIWLNDRPWPLTGGEQVEQTLGTRVRHVIDLPADRVREASDLRIRFANRNLIPPGETRPTAITFPPGDGLTLLVRVGGFEGNFVRCLAIMWSKLALVAAVGVAAGAIFDLPLAILVTVVIFFGSLGNEFFQEALGRYDIVADSAWERTRERMAFAGEFLSKGRFYEAFRMLFGFVTDGVLAVLPSFAADAAIPRLTAGIAIPLGDVIRRFVVFGGVYPVTVGVIGWLIFDRRDLVRSST